MNTPPHPIIELQNIEYIRDANQILRGVSWRVHRGQHWALMGANGSGKTTLLKVVTGYEWPTDGEVFVLGRHFGECDLRELRKSIGWVSSSIEHQFPAHNRAIDVVVSGCDASIGTYREMTPDEWARAAHALDQVGIASLADRAYRLLSQGEQQRVLIARALVNDPALMILDEPCSGLDPAARESFLTDLGRLASQSIAPTLVMVTHHVEEVRPWITHALLLRGGAVLAAGAVQDVLTGEHISAAFDHPFRIERGADRYHLRDSPPA